MMILTIILWVIIYKTNMSIIKKKSHEYSIKIKCLIFSRCSFIQFSQMNYSFFKKNRDVFAFLLNLAFKITTSLH